jgi:hypothetical protein
VRWAEHGCCRTSGRQRRPASAAQPSNPGSSRDRRSERSETLFGSLKAERLRGIEFQHHREAKGRTLDWLLWYKRIENGTLPRAISAQFSSSNKQSLHDLPSQHDREGSTATRQKSKTITLMGARPEGELTS